MQSAQAAAEILPPPMIELARLWSERQVVRVVPREVHRACHLGTSVLKGVKRLRVA